MSVSYKEMKENLIEQMKESNEYFGQKVFNVDIDNLVRAEEIEDEITPVYEDFLENDVFKEAEESNEYFKEQVFYLGIYVGMLINKGIVKRCVDKFDEI